MEYMRSIYNLWQGGSNRLEVYKCIKVTAGGTFSVHVAGRRVTVTNIRNVQFTGQ